MLDNNNKLGLKFKAIRKQRKISLSQLADIAGSIASISDFENGKSHISTDVLMQLLGVLMVDPSEFFEFNFQYLDTDSSSIYSKIQQAAERGDIEAFQFYSDLTEEEYRNKGIYTYHILSIELKLLHQMHNKIKIYNETEKNEIFDYLFSLDVWTTFDISLFGNLVDLFSTNNIGLLTDEIIRSINMPPVNGHDRIIIDTLINAQLVLIKQRAKDASSQLMKKLRSIPLSEHFLIEKIGLKFAEICYNYVFIHPDEKDYKEAAQLFNFMEIYISKSYSKAVQNEFYSIVSSATTVK